MHHLEENDGAIQEEKIPHPYQHLDVKHRGEDGHEPMQADET